MTVSFNTREKIRREYYNLPYRITDTGGLVQVHQGERETNVQGTRQQKLGVTFGRCPAWSNFQVKQKIIWRLFI